MFYRKVLALGFLATVTGCIEQSYNPKDISQDKAERVNIKIENTTFLIPKQYILNPLPKSIVGSEGLDTSTEGFSLDVPLIELGIKSTNGKYWLNDILLSVTRLSEQGPNTNVNNAKNQQGLYKDAIIEKDPVLDLYRLYAPSAYSMLWHYFRVEALPINQSSEWIASCEVNPIIGEKPNLSNVTCQGEANYKEVSIQYTTNAKHFSPDVNLEQTVINAFARWDEANSL